MSKAVGVAVLSKALAISGWSRVLSNRLSIPLFIFVDFFPLTPWRPSTSFVR